jgi:hypothetical protein
MSLHTCSSHKSFPGSNAPKDDFLARNGLRYGKVYGYAIDMSDEGPTHGMWRDTFHLDPEMAHNGAHVPGKWFPIDWQWDGTVRDYHHDGAWDFQVKPPGAKGTEYRFWNSLGNNEAGCKMEHNSPDPRLDKTAFIQGSTCGYFGHYYMHGVAEALANDDDDFPHSINGSYYVYQGELSIVDQIELGGKGQYADGLDATKHYSDDLTVRETFEDLDGLEMFMSKDGHLRAIIQEDSGNNYGERIFITSPLEHEEDGNELTYYLIGKSYVSFVSSHVIYHNIFAHTCLVISLEWRKQQHSHGGRCRHSCWDQQGSWGSRVFWNL